MRGRRLIHIAAGACILAYLIVSFVVVEDYGITWDEPENFAIGHEYLHYYATGELDLEDPGPGFEGHPNFHNHRVARRPFIVWPFTNILSALTCGLFFQRLGWLSATAAHHIIIPILVSGFLYGLFLFVRKHWGDAAGLIAVLALVTTPRFFGHSMNNIKDVPELVFFSASLMAFAQWWLTRRPRFLYATAVLWAFAVATKPDAVLVPVIVGLWVLPDVVRQLWKNSRITARTLAHLAVCAFIMLGIVWLSYPPLHPGQVEKVAFVNNAFEYVTIISRNPNASWNLYAPRHIEYMMPDLLLVMGAVGFVWALVKKRAGSIQFLLALWLVLPVARHCLPKTNHYDGLRHFIVFMVPLSICAAIGIVRLGALMARWLKTKAVYPTVVLAALVLAPSVYAVVSMHPYQTTYFNMRMGGLGGAQQRKFSYSCDYWLNSCRAAGRWLDEHAEPNAAVFGFPLNYQEPFNHILALNVSRRDIRLIGIADVFDDLQPNTYIVFIPRWSAHGHDEIKALVDTLEVKHEVKRQGGLIFTIYYKP